MGLYRDQILPRGVAWAMSGKDIAAERPKCVGRARGRVLEVGFGAGLNLPFYDAQAVEEVLAVEPVAVNQKLARKRVDSVGFPVRFVGLEGESIPVEDASVDTVVSTWTLCTIRDPDRALAEMRRVLRPDGRLLFLEHGLSPEERVARWQNRLNPIQRWCAGGCNLNRKIDDLVRDAGFELEDVVEYYMKGPKAVAYLYSGVGRR